MYGNLNKNETVIHCYEITRLDMFISLVIASPFSMMEHDRPLVFT
jgi:hypothetical protein